MRPDLCDVDLSCVKADSDSAEPPIVTDLHGANLSEADLRGAYITGVFVHSTVFANVDLSATKGLETVHHWGPSTIGVDTIYKSRGKIPEKLLRGCGVPEELIAHIGSMVGRPIEYYSYFISYSTNDQEFADRAYADLQAKRVRCWFARHDIMGGRKIHEQIDEAMRLRDKLMLILSEHSMASEWVKTEIAKARKREAQEKRQMLFLFRGKHSRHQVVAFRQGLYVFLDAPPPLCLLQDQAHQHDFHVDRTPADSFLEPISLILPDGLGIDIDDRNAAQ